MVQYMREKLKKREKESERVCAERMTVGDARMIGKMIIRESKQVKKIENSLILPCAVDICMSNHKHYS